MTSRLERLFLLLESGQSAFIRKSAAYQIGEVVKSHPNELGALLDKLKALITNSSWDTRIAASQTVDSIVKNINEFDFISIIDESHVDLNDYSRLDDFNLFNLLKSGAKLLSSDTQKYEVKEMDDANAALLSTDNRPTSEHLNEKIKQQRKLLNLKLGIDFSGAAKIDTTHIFSDYDLIASSNVVNSNDEPSMGNTNSTHSIKRKASLDEESDVIKSETIESTEVFIKCEQSAVVESGESSQTTDILMKIKKFKKTEMSDMAEMSTVNDETTNQETKNHLKSLELFVQWLLNKLFDSEWETRHGAATCLREIIKNLIGVFVKNAKSLNCPSTIIKMNNFSWFQDILVKLLSVIALDRFADYVGDEAVAPVRETCAQTIGIIASTFDTAHLAKLCSILNVFLSEKNESCWEVRHSGIMVLKYVIAAISNSTNESAQEGGNSISTNELSMSSTAHQMQSLKQIFNHTFGQIINCICDKDDDVRQVSTASLDPISKHLNSLLSDEQLELLIKVLVDVLAEIDDLGTSCAIIMRLMSDLLSHDDAKIKHIFLRLLNGQSVVPRLLPFLQHNSFHVKQTTLNTINKIVLAINESKVYKFEAMESQENLVVLFRLLYQQSILLPSEQSFTMLEQLLFDLWRTLCYELSPHLLVNICFPFITTWLLLFMHPTNQPIDSIYMLTNHSLLNLNSSSSTTASHETKEYLGSNQIKFENKQTRDVVQIKCRLLAAKLLAVLFDRIASIEHTDANSKEKPIMLIIEFLSNQVNFKSGLQRFCFALLMIEWAQLMKDHVTINNDLIKQRLATKIINCLDDENTIYFDEIAVYFTRLQKECRNLLANFGKLLGKHVDLSKFATLNVFTFEDIGQLTTLIRETYLDKVNETSSTLKAMQADLRSLVHNLEELNQQTIQEQEVLQSRSCFALASASIQMNCLCERMNPLIRPLIDCIRFESNADLQALAGKHLALLLNICCKRNPNPVPKIFKNLVGYLCNDEQKTPVIERMSNMHSLPDKEFYEMNRFFGILSDTLAVYLNEECTSTNGSANNGTTPKIKKRAISVNEAATPTSAITPHPSATMDQQQVVKAQIERRGAEQTLKAICQLYDDQVETVLPELVQQPLGVLNFIVDLVNTYKSKENELLLINELNLDAHVKSYQDIINNLCLIEFVCLSNCLNKNVLAKFVDQVPNILKLIKSPITGVRHTAARCLAAICKQELVKTMNLSLEFTFDCLEMNEFSLFSRQGAIELVYCLFDKLNELIIPFTVIFIVPVLRRMCDLDWYVRSVASQCFGTLVKLYPLSITDSTNDGSNNASPIFDSLNQITAINKNILRMKCEQQDFLDQLMDNRKLKPYELPMESLKEVKLRPYQQMGVNWLAFLKKFNLHGILCDDMGLGKTLQTICILAGDHNEKMRIGKSNERAQFEDDLKLKFMPSIIICPTTLTNHWYHEIENFVHSTCLSPFIYHGSVSEREALRRKFFEGKKHNIFIVSYDIIRHDIMHLCGQQWNYCILDEGHIIKSSKTKLSKSIKQIRAAHRLILTGTPIQNNVTELWCLFDFLIPGYLGTEKQFHHKYARYIVPQSATFQRSFSIQMAQANKNTNNQDTGASSNDKGFNQQSIMALESLHKQVLPFLLRRTKEEVLNDLPPKIIQDYYCEMSQLQVELYEDFAKSEASENIKKSLGVSGLFNEDQMDLDLDDQVPSASVKAKESSNGNGEHVFHALQYLRKVVNHPSLVLKPDHPKWAKIQAELKASNTNINDIRHSGKLIALRDLLMECGIGSTNGDDDVPSEFGNGADSVLNQHRVLIFCQLKSMIDIIESELLRKMVNVSYLRLDGTIPPSERFGIVRKFNSDPSIDILLLTTQIGGLGLNLTGADTVIFFEHDWNPQKDLQAMDRAHRIGQTRVVNVYRLITKRTIEEKIMGLQRFKLGIANSVVNIENSTLSSMGTEQLINMFNKEEKNANEKKENGKHKNALETGNGMYQRLLDNISELWDENQYENEFNMDGFIKSLSSQK